MNDLKEVYNFPRGDNLPVRAPGSRWIVHKRRALHRVLNRYGAYMNHLASLCEDASVRSPDRQHLKGYLTQWTHAKIILSCAHYIDILDPVASLSLSLQGDDLDIIKAIQSVLKSHRAMEQLKETPLTNWFAIRRVMDNLLESADGKTTYQGIELHHFNDVVVNSCRQQALSDLRKTTYQGIELHHFNDVVVNSCRQQALSDLRKLDDELKERLSWSDTKLMRAIMVFLDTQAWYSHKTDESFSLQLTEAVSMLVENFRAPLEAKATDLAAIQEEAKEMLDYAHQYLRVDRDGYQHVWYHLAFGPDCTRFRNLVAIAQLLFSLPFSTAKVERLFSRLKLIKTDRRTSLSQKTLSDLLEVSVEGTKLENFDSSAAVQLWWSDCSRTRHESHPPKKEN